MTKQEQRIVYRHTNLIAQDWKRLADFYITVFGCKPVPPERNLSGEWLDLATGIDHAHIRGMHLLMPGFEAGGPTLEIFSYDDNLPGSQPPAANRVGLGHLAFAVWDVVEMVERVITHGGDKLGEVVTTEVPGVGTLLFVYALDPEGNVIELQSWS